MPRDVHKSLELLEEYHSELFRPTDSELKQSIERVIGIFKANLFNALCDIQEFYDNVLLNGRLPQGEKVFETRRFADRWEQRTPWAVGVGDRVTQPSAYNYFAAEAASRQTFSRQGFEPSFRGVVPLESSIRSTSTALLETAPVNKLVDEFGREWEVEEVLLDASQTGLGFSISGGRDRDPEPDFYIRVTDISAGGAVARDGRIKVGDVILKVNDADCVDVNHQFAVNALQRAGPFVRLLVKRLRPQRSLSQSHLEYPRSQKEDQRSIVVPSRSRSLHQLPQQHPSRQPSRLSSHHSGSGLQYTPQQLPESTKAPRMVTLRKGDNGLGFNIVGGEDGEPIYVSHVLPGGVADLSGNIRKGDVLLRVGDIDLQGAGHGQAALTLKSIPQNTFVNLLMQYRPRDYHQFEDKVERLRKDLLLQQQNATVGFR